MSDVTVSPEENPRVILGYLLSMAIKNLAIFAGLVMCRGRQEDIDQVCLEVRSHLGAAEDYYRKHAGALSTGGNGDHG